MNLPNSVPALGTFQFQQQTHLDYYASYGAHMQPPSGSYHNPLAMAQNHYLSEHLNQTSTATGTVARPPQRRQPGQSSDCPCTNCWLVQTGRAAPVRDAAGKLVHNCPQPDCPNAYTKISHLKVHHMKHTGERPHRCGWCPSSFTRSDELNRHLRTHTKEKSFHCDECAKGFGRSDHLKKHQLTHANRARREAARAARRAGATEAVPVAPEMGAVPATGQQPSGQLDRWAQRHQIAGSAAQGSVATTTTSYSANPPTPPTSDQSSEAWIDQRPAYGPDPAAAGRWPNAGGHTPESERSYTSAGAGQSDVAAMRMQPHIVQQQQQPPAFAAYQPQYAAMPQTAQYDGHLQHHQQHHQHQQQQYYQQQQHYPQMPGTYPGYCACLACVFP